ncbi:MAG: indolepyruvate oxidoreductase subunit beta [Bacillota bacterium]|nr:indolepyruvate oxidoreductase subunit beta [Bacillota bacterium]
MSKRLSHDPLNIVVCGIGGQGNILASELLGSSMVEGGYIVAIGETYGASQRGGSVMSHIRISQQTELGVLISQGEAHVIIGFEPLESLRMAREYGSGQTKVIYDPRPVYPLSVLIGEDSYPTIEQIDAELRQLCDGVFPVAAADIAAQAGSSKAANIALMGALTALDIVPMQRKDFETALRQRFKGELLELNQKAYEMGYNAVVKQL